MRAQQVGADSQKRNSEDSEKPAPAASNLSPPKQKRKRRFPFRKVAELEVDIAASETRLREFEVLLASPDLYRDGEKVKEATRGFEEAKAQLQQLYEHWEEAVELN
jgi:ATP-binding cassette subfamily F protein 3